MDEGTKQGWLRHETTNGESDRSVPNTAQFSARLSRVRTQCCVPHKAAFHPQRLSLPAGELSASFANKVAQDVSFANYPAETQYGWYGKASVVQVRFTGNGAKQGYVSTTAEWKLGTVQARVYHLDTGSVPAYTAPADAYKGRPTSYGVEAAPTAGSACFFGHCYKLYELHRPVLQRRLEVAERCNPL